MVQIRISRGRLKRAAVFYLLMLPGLLYFFINNYLPMSGIVIAFNDMNYQLGIYRSPWVGFSNFIFLVKSGSLFTMVRNTVLYNIAFISLGTFLAVTTAILLNEIRSRLASRLYQTLILFPYLISMVIVNYLVFAFLSGENGFINKAILPIFGKQRILFYQEQKYWPFILVFVNEWKSIGFNMVIFYSSIVSISDDLYEAASIDGATKFQQIRHITLPEISSTVITMVLLSISKILNSDFDLFYQIPRNSGILYPVTQTIDTYVYQALMNQNSPGRSAAAGLIQSVVGCVLVISVNGIIKKLKSDSALF